MLHFRSMVSQKALLLMIDADICFAHSVSFVAELPAIEYLPYHSHTDHTVIAVCVRLKCPQSEPVDPEFAAHDLHVG